ncbi:hypothetical protein RFI_27716, partial [Reticulomyxa filosa]
MEVNDPSEPMKESNELEQRRPVSEALERQTVVAIQGQLDILDEVQTRNAQDSVRLEGQHEQAFANGDTTTTTTTTTTTEIIIERESVPIDSI